MVMVSHQTLIVMRLTRTHPVAVAATLPSRVFNEQGCRDEADVETGVEELGQGIVIPPQFSQGFPSDTDHSSSEGIHMVAALPFETASELAHRVAIVRASVPMDELAAEVEGMGECQRFDTARWYLGTQGARTLARDLIQTEDEREVCQGCPVRDRCLALAVLTGDTKDSIHGGLLPQQQRQVARELQLEAA
jgi:hypothetical protein